MRRLVTTLAICGLAAALLAPGIVAKTSGPGTSTGTGTVYFPNPAASLGIQTLTDQKDADYAALHDAQVAGFGVGSEAGAIGEGFGDYLAVTVSNVIDTNADTPCVADWDAVSYTRNAPHCLRRVDVNLRYPVDLTGEVHADGRSGREPYGISAARWATSRPTP